MTWNDSYFWYKFSIRGTSFGLIHVGRGFAACTLVIEVLCFVWGVNNHQLKISGGMNVLRWKMNHASWSNASSKVVLVLAWEDEVGPTPWLISGSGWWFGHLCILSWPQIPSIHVICTPTYYFSLVFVFFALLTGFGMEGLAILTFFV